MTHRANYECAICAKPNIWIDGTLTKGWVKTGEGAICGDCDRFARQGVEPQPFAPVEDFVRCETAIPLRSGSYLDLANPDCSVIQPIDIAAGLRQPRFGAQTRDFYTIAQHSLLVLRLVSPIARQLGGDKGLQLRRCALMHDAAEAFIHDIVTPLKRQIAGAYRPIEARLEQRLADRFGWSWTDYRREQVKLADIQALAIEQRDLVGRTDPWPIFDALDRAVLRSVKITRCWHPDEAEERFLAAFAELFPSEERLAA
jgi:hypothetical protein